MEIVATKSLALNRLTATDYSDVGLCERESVRPSKKSNINFNLIPKVLICIYLIVVLLLLVTNYTAGRWGSPQNR